MSETSFDPHHCNKCGGTVEPSNDAVRLEIIHSGSAMLIFAVPRHLFPVIGEHGEVLCEGSPSRAQYLEGQPPDPRDAYAYRPEFEESYRAAYAQLLTETARTAP